MFIVLVSSMGTAQRVIIGRSKIFTFFASSQSGANWWMFGAMKSETRTQMRSSTRRVAMYTRPTGLSLNSSSGSTPQAAVNWTPLTIACRKAPCTGSMQFSFTCSQLHGQI